MISVATVVLICSDPTWELLDVFVWLSVVPVLRLWGPAQPRTLKVVCVLISLSHQVVRNRDLIGQIHALFACRELYLNRILSLWNWFVSDKCIWIPRVSCTWISHRSVNAHSPSISVCNTQFFHWQQLMRN